ncbi:MAG: hypothetical protein DMG55_30300 [Acidobacteria bacterium]|nr:MAG: hypothetical protein DMG55_30300 [Acidobacteriota bacterium]
MPRYLTQHTLACLTRQGAEALAQRMTAGGLAHAERVLVNMLEGKMFVEFRANSREDLEAWHRGHAFRLPRSNRVGNTGRQTATGGVENSVISAFSCARLFPSLQEEDHV